MTLNRWLALTAAALGLFAAVRAQTHSPVTPPPPASVRVDQFQNDAVKVWRTTVLPNAPLTLHRHDHPRVIVALSDGSMDLIDAHGHHDLHIWKKDQAYWLPAMAPGELHMDVDATSKPLEVMVIELEKEK